MCFPSLSLLTKIFLLHKSLSKNYLLSGTHVHARARILFRYPACEEEIVKDRENKNKIKLINISSICETV